MRNDQMHSRHNLPNVTAAEGDSDIMAAHREDSSMPVSLIQSAHRLVVKVGSSLVTNEGRGLDHVALARWAAEIAELRRLGKDVVLVSSGAVAEGVARLGWSEKPKSIHEKQAAAAVGQMGLCQAYESAFRQHGLKTAQVLLTHEDMADRTRYLNARSTLLTLLSLGVVPIINENDTVVTAEIKFGDNDTLGALVTNLIEGDALVILTDQQGLYTADPRRDPAAKLIDEAVAGTAELEAMAGGAGSSVGTGGMFTKVIAAKRAARSGAATIIASGREANVLTRLANGEAIGTQLVAQTTPLAAKKQWIADHLQIRGRLLLDAGAVRAVLERGSSLLPIGVVAVEGDFQRGDIVRCIGADDTEIARGIVNYSSQDARKIARLPTGQIESALGYIDEPELIHRDNLLVV
jgi:glutamate 5-kinase